MAPLDTEARRQQARVAGWSGDVDRAERLYRDLVRAHPDDPVLAAEAAAKTAFLTGRWRVAIPAYQKWLALEPGDTEAQFELAESQRATGALAAADDTLRALASLPTPHRLAADALDRAGLNRTPSAVVATHVRSANGYGGQRLLDLREQDAVFTHAWGADDATVMSAEGADVRAAGAGSARAGYRVGLSGTHRLSPAWQVEAAAARWTFGRRAGVADLQGLVTWRPVDCWTLVAGATRQPIFESLTTVDERLAASGVLAEVQFASPVMSVEARVARQSLSDGNARSDATVSASRAVGERWRGLRAVLWGEHLSYRREAAGYFSPSAFTRVDGGIEHDHDFTAPRFRGDRRNTLALGYLVGVDGRGGRYQHPSIRLSVELRPGLTLDASAGAIRLADYHETTALVSLRIGGLTPQ